MRSILLLLFLLPGWVFGQMDLDLRKCREMALQNSQEVAIAGKQQEKAGFEAKAYRADYWPKLSAVGLGFYNQKKYDYKLKGGYLPTYVPGENGQLQPNVMIDPGTQRPVVGADGNPVFNEYAFLPDIHLTVGLRGVYTAGLQLEQPIYMGGKVRTAHHMAKIGETMAGQNVRLNRSEITIQVDEAYWQLLRVQEQVSVAEKYRDVVRELVKNLQDAKAVGMAMNNDVLKAQVRYNEAELMLQKAHNGQILAGMNLCRLIGLDLRSSVRLQDTLSETISTNLWELDSNVAQRPDYHILENDMKLKERQIALVRADFLPQIGVTAGYGYSGGLKLNGEDEADATFSAMAAVKIPVFHWGEARNKVRAARMDEEISRLNLENLSNQMQLEVASARFNVVDARNRIVMTRNALLQAKENLKISNDQYQVGLESLADLLEAQAQWQQALSQWIDAKAMLHLGESKYLKAIGKLVEE